MTEAEELQYYRRLNAQALGNKETRETYLRLRKALNPEIPIPEIDEPEKLRAEIEAKFATRDEAEAKFRKEQADKEFIAEYNRRKESLKGPPYYLRDTDLPAVEKLIEERGFPSLELAADYYRNVSEPIKPSGLGIMGLSQSKGSLDQRKEFNARYQKIFKPRSAKYKETFDNAWKDIESGDYLNK